MTWIPLESNPDVMNKFLYKLGMPNKYHVVDVCGLDPELLATVPKPVLSIVLLFPFSDKYTEDNTKQEDEIKKKGQIVTEKIFYMKQVEPNACGTIALVHSVANNLDKIDLQEGHLKKFIDATKNLNPDEKGKSLEKADGIISAHKEAALEGQTAPTEEVKYHFITFVHRDGHLYELDGRKSFPVNLGESTNDSFLEDAARVCKEYMSKYPDELRFSVVALTVAE
ncbi:Ubiquitin carboxyl-terminal hydrolase [Gryllus bimaculatus]|nr:Ubiquitin carboxyl-terminal hydrolase [Gryllus bimaculatus]